MNANENTKTIWFLAAAALLAGVAWFVNRPGETVKPQRRCWTPSSLATSTTRAPSPR